MCCLLLSQHWHHQPLAKRELCKKKRKPSKTLLPLQLLSTILNLSQQTWNLLWLCAGYVCWHLLEPMLLCRPPHWEEQPAKPYSNDFLQWWGLSIFHQCPHICVCVCVCRCVCACVGVRVRVCVCVCDISLLDGALWCALKEYLQKDVYILLHYAEWRLCYFRLWSFKENAAVRPSDAFETSII